MTDTEKAEISSAVQAASLLLAAFTDEQKVVMLLSMAVSICDKRGLDLEKYVSISKNGLAINELKMTD